MNFDEVVSKRRSIRSYLDKEVEEDKIKEIVKCGILAPSAHNRQPWKIKVLKGDETNQVGELLLEKKDLAPSIENTANIIIEAPVLIVIFYDKTEGQRDNDILSIGAFIENMHLKATELGLGSLWIANTNYIKEEIKELINTDLECISTLAIGYKKQDPNQRPRKKQEEIMM